MASRLKETFMNQARLRFFRTGSLWLLLAVVVPCGTAAAADQNVIFTIDSSQSTENWSGLDNTYGPYSAQSTGSLSAPVEGHFVVAFDPTNDTPSTIQFLSNSAHNDGYFQLDNSTQSAQPFGTPANEAATAGANSQFAIRNLTWAFSSPAITSTSSVGTSTTYGGTSTSFFVTKGGIDFTTSNGPASSSYVGSTGSLTGGTWTLAESAAGSGNWTLTLNGHYDYTYNTGSGGTTGSLSASGVVVSTAHFAVGTPNSNVSAGSVATVPQPTTGGVEAQVLGGAGTTGGVTLDFGQTITGGAVTIQQVPSIPALTPAAVAAGEANPIFALSTADTVIGAPQIWSVNFAGALNGSSATLVFNYDPSTLPVGTDQSQLGIWHFNENTGHWEFGGTVDVADHTITFVTSSFSPFSLGIQAVPEPATIVLALGGLLSMAYVAWRRRKMAAAIHA